MNSRFTLEEDSMRSSRLSRSVSGLAFAVAGALAMWSCGGGGYSSSAPSPASPSPTPAPSGPSIVVNIGASTGSTAYNPNPVPAAVGDTVAFKNGDSTVHHIVLDDGSADLGDLNPGATSRAITVKAGGATFHCTLHSSMVGAINGPVPEAPPCTLGPGYC
jgi:plastocyanin